MGSYYMKCLKNGSSSCPVSISLHKLFPMSAIYHGIESTVYQVDMINSKLQFTRGILPSCIIIINRTCLYIYITNYALIWWQIWETGNLREWESFWFSTHARLGLGGQWTVRSKGTLKTTQVCRGASRLLPHTNAATALQISSIQIYTTGEHSTEKC